MHCIYKYNSIIGDIFISADENFLLSVQFVNHNFIENQENKIIRQTIKQFDEYFRGKRKKFELPLNPKGTEFQKKVWLQFIKIPYGKTATYKDIATLIGNSNASRAVGNANNKNPIPIFIPCHRVIGKNGKLTGYRGGLYLKQFLIQLEK